MPAYATRAEFEEFVEGWTTDDAAALDRLLERASNDVDQILGDYVLNETGDFAGLKLDKDDLDYTETRAITRATCAQAHYRFTMGEDFFINPRYRETTGPEFGTNGTPPRVSSAAVRELAGTGLLRNMTSFGRHMLSPEWADFTHNLNYD